MHKNGGVFPFQSDQRNRTYGVCIESEFACLSSYPTTALILVVCCTHTRNLRIAWPRELVAGLRLLVYLMGTVPFKYLYEKKSVAVKGKHMAVGTLEDVSDCVGVATCISRLS